MDFSGGSTGIVTCLKPQGKGMVIQATADNKDFFWVGMGFSAKGGGIGTGVKSSQPSIFPSIGIKAEGEVFCHGF
jgi:hypothetical protein